MLAALLYFVVAGVTLAVGRNMFRTARESAQAEADAVGFGGGYVEPRAWSLRFGGVFLFLLGLALLVAGIISAWRLGTAS